MASFTASYVNPRTGQHRRVPVGFSWTTLFFGGFVPLFRGDTVWFFIMWLLTFVTFGLAWAVFPFVYNERYSNRLINDGFQQEGESTSPSSSLLGITR